VPVSDLHALVTGFADVAAAYERGRPDYPPFVVERIVAEVGVNTAQNAAHPSARVLDLAAGTGKLARPLLAAGLDVVAVEPLEPMRAALARAIGPERVLAGRAEAIPLGDASLDGAACAEAFHWFDGERAAAELHRVLRPGGGLVVMWLHETGHFDSWGAEIRAVLEPLWRAARHPGLVGGHRVDALERHGGFAPVRRVELAFEDPIDRDGLLAWYASFSYVGTLGDAERIRLLERLAAILDRNGVTTVRRPWRAELWVTRRRG
jgi:SAM-dependent methyltransferase